MKYHKRAISLLMALVLCIGLLSSQAFAATTEVKTEEDLRNALARGGNLVLGSDIGTEITLTVSASSTLDLNGYKLTIITKKNSGIVIEVGQTLTITDSKYSVNGANDGKLYISGYRAGIQTSGAALIINSGVVESTGQWATGIGGIDDTGYRDGGSVTINGGIVTATGGCPGSIGGAGIGGMGATFGLSGNGGTVTINGGTVVATGGKYGAGIGGGGLAGGSIVEPGGAGGTVTINGGTVCARSNTNGNGAADIGGGGHSVDGGTVKINGGTVELASTGTNARSLSLKSCTITGEGAGEYKGSYDANGNRVVVNGASAWASDDLAQAIVNSLVPVYLQSDYTQPTTRAQFCALAVALYENVMGKQITERKEFSDTSDSNIEKMGALGVITGTGGNRSDPDGTLTREQAATMLARLMKAMDKPLPEQYASFADRNQISSWAITAVGQMQGAGIMGSVGNNMFNPAGSYTREQSIVTMLRLFNAAR